MTTFIKASNELIIVGEEACHHSVNALCILFFSGISISPPIDKATNLRSPMQIQYRPAVVRQLAKDVVVQELPTTLAPT